MSIEPTFSLSFLTILKDINSSIPNNILSKFLNGYKLAESYHYNEAKVILVDVKNIISKYIICNSEVKYTVLNNSNNGTAELGSINLLPESYFQLHWFLLYLLSTLSLESWEIDSGIKYCDSALALIDEFTPHISSVLNKTVIRMTGSLRLKLINKADAAEEPVPSGLTGSLLNLVDKKVDDNMKPSPIPKNLATEPSKPLLFKKPFQSASKVIDERKLNSKSLSKSHNSHSHKSLSKTHISNSHKSLTTMNSKVENKSFNSNSVSSLNFVIHKKVLPSKKEFKKSVDDNFIGLKRKDFNFQIIATKDDNNLTPESILNKFGDIPSLPSPVCPPSLNDNKDNYVDLDILSKKTLATGLADNIVASSEVFEMKQKLDYALMIAEIAAEKFKEMETSFNEVQSEADKLIGINTKINNNFQILRGENSALKKQIFDLTDKINLLNYGSDKNDSAILYSKTFSDLQESERAKLRLASEVHVLNGLIETTSSLLDKDQISLKRIKFALTESEKEKERNIVYAEYLKKQLQSMYTHTREQEYKWRALIKNQSLIMDKEKDQVSFDFKIESDLLNFNIVQKLENRNLELSSEVESLKLALANKKKLNEDHEPTYAELNGIYEDLKLKYSDSLAQLKQANDLINEFNSKLSEIEGLPSGNEAIQNELKLKIRKEIELNTLLNASNELNAVSQQKLTFLEVENISLQSEMASIRSELNTLRSMKNKEKVSTMGIETSLKIIKENEIQISKLEENIDELSTNKKYLDETLKLVEIAQKQKDEYITTIGNQKDELSSSNLILIAKLSTLEKDLLFKDSSIENLNSEINLLKSKFMRKEQELAEVMRTIAQKDAFSKNKEINELQQFVSILRQNIKDRDDTITSLNQDLISSTNSLNNKISFYDSELSEKDNIIKVYKLKASDLSLQFDKLDLNLKDFQNENDRIKLESLELRQKYDKLYSEKIKTENAFHSNYKLANVSRCDVETNTADSFVDLKNYISNLKVEYQKLFEDNVSKADDIQKLKLSLSSLAKDHVELQNKIDSLSLPTLNYDTSSSSIDSSISFFDSHSSLNINTNNIISQLSDEISILKTDKEFYENETSKLLIYIKEFELKVEKGETSRYICELQIQDLETQLKIESDHQKNLVSFYDSKIFSLENLIKELTPLNFNDIKKLSDSLNRLEEENDELKSKLKEISSYADSSRIDEEVQKFLKSNNQSILENFRLQESTTSSFSSSTLIDINFKLHEQVAYLEQSNIDLSEKLDEKLIFIKNAQNLNLKDVTASSPNDCNIVNVSKSFIFVEPTLIDTPKVCLNCCNLEQKCSELKKVLKQREDVLQIIHSLIRVKKSRGTFSRLESDSFISNFHSWFNLHDCNTKKIEWNDFFGECEKHVNLSNDVSRFSSNLEQSLFISMFLERIGVSLGDFELDDKACIILSKHSRELELDNYYLKRLVVELENANSVKSDTIENLIKNKTKSFSFMNFGKIAQLRWFLEHPADILHNSLPSIPFSALNLPIMSNIKIPNPRSLWMSESIEMIQPIY